MIYKYKWAVLILVLFLGLYSCNLDASRGKSLKQKSVITVYGSKTCHHCTVFETWLDEQKLKYTFYDVNTDKEARMEMLNKVKGAKIKGRILYPVVDIDGKILIRPETKMIESLLKK